jgi:hypothetical protein
VIEERNDIAAPFVVFSVIVWFLFSVDLPLVTLVSNLVDRNCFSLALIRKIPDIAGC